MVNQKTLSRKVFKIIDTTRKIVNVLLNAKKGKPASWAPQWNSVGLVAFSN
jgi:hypothetical protein